VYHPDGRPEVNVPSGITYQLLQFWTVSAIFRLGNVDTLEKAASLLGENNVLCGQVHFDNFAEPTFFESSGPFEVILLSETCFPLFKREDWNIDIDDSKTPAFYNVMLHEWRGTLAERRGVEGIYKKAVSQSLSPGPIWKEILLG
jgi:hypothetical protein